MKHARINRRSSTGIVDFSSLLMEINLLVEIGLIVTESIEVFLGYLSIQPGLQLKED